MPLPSVFQGVQACRLPALKPPKPSRRPPRQQLLQLHAPAIDFIRRPRPLPRQGRRLGPPEVWNLALLKRSKPFRRPPRQQLLQLHAPAICFQGVQDCRLPGLKPPKTLPQASKATTLTATCPCHLFFRGFKTAVCPASNPPNPSAGLQGNNSYTCHLFFRGFKTAVCPAFEPPEKQMAGACSCKSCCLGGLRKGLGGLRPGKRQS